MDEKEKRREGRRGVMLNVTHYYLSNQVHSNPPKIPPFDFAINIPENLKFDTLYRSNHFLLSLSIYMVFYA